MYKYKHFKKIRGFTLLETLTSVAILAIVIIGPLAAIMSSSFYARQSKDAIVANYLAEEAIELIQNQYDSLYILCKKNPTDVYCTTGTEETSGQISWRLFKDRFAAVDGQPSCYIAANPDGCSFDYISMTNDPTITPIRYIANQTECPELVEATTTVMVMNGGGTQGGADGVTPTFTQQERHSYVCKGVSAHIPGTVSTKSFSRAVSIERIPSTFANGKMLDQDDLKIISTVRFKISNGGNSTIQIVRFMHAQP
jgi:prepilin-type N-terminal cleavage/methylation domain-containing protein